jgi:hypothetical protein
MFASLTAARCKRPTFTNKLIIIACWAFFSESTGSYTMFSCFHLSRLKRQRSSLGFIGKSALFSRSPCYRPVGKHKLPSNAPPEYRSPINWIDDKTGKERFERVYTTQAAKLVKSPALAFFNPQMSELIGFTTARFSQMTYLSFYENRDCVDLVDYLWWGCRGVGQGFSHKRVAALNI